MYPTSTTAAQVANLNFFVMGFRGDWKAYRQVFNLVRHYNAEEDWI